MKRARVRVCESEKRVRMCEIEERVRACERVSDWGRNRGKERRKEEKGPAQRPRRTIPPSKTTEGPNLIRFQ